MILIIYVISILCHQMNGGKTNNTGGISLVSPNLSGKDKTLTFKKKSPLLDLQAD